ncbi:hypothetical protein [Verrucomicrobium spinosum]|uniref:hypothetical protein n=1 Tax=Verrucomicrobium spinosum TaxID=2736 RepID=UPI00094667A5
MTDKGFTSTSATKSFEGSHQFSITSPGGRDVSFLSKYPEEVEVLYPPNHQFQIVSRIGTVDYGARPTRPARRSTPGSPRHRSSSSKNNSLSSGISPSPHRHGNHPSQHSSSAAHRRGTGPDR